MKKLAKIVIILLIIFALILIGRRIYYSKVGIAPEDLYLTKENSEEEYRANKGTYQWDDKGLQVIADSISPLEMEFTRSIQVKPNEKIYFNDCEWTNVSSTVILQKDEKEVARISIESNLEENYIVVPTIAAGEYIVQINLTSSKGNVWYAAKINITE